MIIQDQIDLAKTFIINTIHKGRLIYQIDSKDTNIYVLPTKMHIEALLVLADVGAFRYATDLLPYLENRVFALEQGKCLVNDKGQPITVDNSLYALLAIKLGDISLAKQLLLALKNCVHDNGILLMHPCIQAPDELSVSPIYGPIIVAFLSMYESTQDDEYLQVAIKTYDIMSKSTYVHDYWTVKALKELYKHIKTEKLFIASREIVAGMKKMDVKHLTSYVSAIFQQSMLAYIDFCKTINNEMQTEWLSNYCAELYDHQSALQITNQHPHKWQDTYIGGFVNSTFDNVIKTDSCIQNLQSLLRYKEYLDDTLNK